MKGKNILIGVLVVAITASVIMAGIPTRGMEGNNMPWTANATKMDVKIVKLGSNVATANDGNVLVSAGSEFDDHRPAITTDSNGHIVVTWTQQISLLQAEIGWAYSSDGSSWTGYVTSSGGDLEYSDISWQDCKTYTGLFGIFMDMGNQANGFYLISDITDPTTAQLYTWNEETPEQVAACVADNTYLEGQYYDVDGPACMYIYHFVYGEYDIPGCPEQMITDPTGGSGEGTFDGQTHLITAPAENPDMAGVNMDVHYAWDFFNSTLNKNEIVWKKIIPVEGDTDSTDIEYTPYQQYIDVGMDPAISKSGDNVIIVYMNNDNGNWDIKCAYSHDDGATWTIGTVASTSADEMYPDVYMAGNAVYCAYVSNGNLYLVKSTDGGATWGEPLQINDQDGSVVAEPGTVDVSQAGIVWTDNRNGNMDIYYASLPAPHIEIAVSGGLGITATISNTGTEAAKNVQWSIDVSGGLVILGKHAEGSVDEIQPGQSITVKDMPIGIGPVTVTVTAFGQTAKASGLLLGPLVLGLK